MDDTIIRYEKEKRCTCTLYITESCNLKCIYCYERQKGSQMMSMEIAQQGIEATFKRAVEENIEFVEILFHGGEPFLAFERIKEVCNWLWSKKWPTRYICYATTNGTLIHSEIKQWLVSNKEKFVVGLSLDGTREMHNCNRPNLSYDKIDIPFFIETWPEQGVKMTPSSDTLPMLAEGIIHLHNLGIKKNNCTFACGVPWDVDSKGNKVDYQSILQEQLMQLALYYLTYPDILPVEMINPNFAVIGAGIESIETKLCGAGTIMRCWCPDGQCLPCHLFYEAYKETGENFSELNLSSPVNLSDSRCKGCILEMICPTCYGGNYITFKDITKRDPYTCEITKIRAIAGSWMIGQMLEVPSKYAALSSLSENELAMTAKGVMMTQKLLF